MLGLDWMDEAEHRQRWNMVVGNSRTRGTQFQDYDIKLYTTSLFTEINHQLAAPLEAGGGRSLRRFSGDLDERIPTSNSFPASDPLHFLAQGRLLHTLAFGLGGL